MYHHLLLEMAYLVSRQAKSCYSKEFFLLGDMLSSKLKITLTLIRKFYPDIKFYLCRIGGGYALLMYKYKFQKEIYKSLYTGKNFDKKSVIWGVKGLFYGYSPHEIQKKFDENLASGMTISE